MLESWELFLSTVLGKIKWNNPLGQISKLETWGRISLSETHFDVVCVNMALKSLKYSYSLYTALHCKYTFVWQTVLSEFIKKNFN